MLLTPVTVANITNDLEAFGLIVSRRQKIDKTRGQPPIAFELNPQAGNAIGISLEPGRASAALVNLVGEIRSRCEVRVGVEVLTPGTLPKTEFKAKRVRDERDG